MSKSHQEYDTIVDQLINEVIEQANRTQRAQNDRSIFDFVDHTRVLQALSSLLEHLSNPNDKDHTINDVINRWLQKVVGKEISRSEGLNELMKDPDLAIMLSFIIEISKNYGKYTLNQPQALAAADVGKKHENTTEYKRNLKKEKVDENIGQENVNPMLKKNQ